MMEWIINNWSMIVTIILLAITTYTYIRKFVVLTPEQQLSALKQRLLTWVTEAEQIYGSGTGLFKLHYVYDLMCKEYPILSKVITIDKLDEMLQDALDILKKKLSNDVVKQNILG